MKLYKLVSRYTGRPIELPFSQLDPSQKEYVLQEKRKKKQKFRRLRAKREARALELRAKDKQEQNK